MDIEAGGGGEEGGWRGASVCRMWLVQEEEEEEGEGSGMLLASGAVPIDTRQLYIVVRWSRNQREPLHKQKKSRPKKCLNGSVQLVRE